MVVVDFEAGRCGGWTIARKALNTKQRGGKAAP
jgi:hypothetical protein